MARVRSPVLPDTKTIFEILPNLNADQQWLIDFRANLNDLGRLLVTSPGVPADRLVFLREAIKRSLTNPELIKEGERVQREFRYQPPDEAMAVVRKVLVDITPAQKQRIKEVLTYNK